MPIFGTFGLLLGIQCIETNNPVSIASYTIGIVLIVRNDLVYI